MTPPRRRVLILCTANACRSQMAEGLWRHLGGKHWDVFSAGLHATRVHPLAIRVMDEIGIDIRRQASEPLDRYRNQAFDLVITVCDHVERQCPTVPHVAYRLHWPFPDPDAAEGDERQRLRAFRNVRDQIAWRIRAFLAETGTLSNTRLPTPVRQPTDGRQPPSTGNA